MAGTDNQNEEAARPKFGLEKNDDVTRLLFGISTKDIRQRPINYKCTNIHELGILKSSPLNSTDTN
jgi:hypothetical protein